MLQYTLKNFVFRVAVSGETVTTTEQLDKSIKNVTSILLTSNYEDLLYTRGTLRLEVNKEEVFPDNTDSKRFTTSFNVPSNQKPYKFSTPLRSGNGIVKVTYVDVPDGRTVFAPYWVKVSLECENEL